MLLYPRYLSPCQCWRPCSHTLRPPCLVGRGYNGEFQAALNSSFYELFTFHFKDEKTEAQRCKWFCKKALLLWTAAMPLGSGAHLDLNPNPFHRYPTPQIPLQGDEFTSTAPFRVILVSWTCVKCSAVILQCNKPHGWVQVRKPRPRGASRTSSRSLQSRLGLPDSRPTAPPTLQVSLGSSG